MRKRRCATACSFDSAGVRAQARTHTWLPAASFSTQLDAGAADRAAELEEALADAQKVIKDQEEALADAQKLNMDLVSALQLPATSATVHRSKLAVRLNIQTSRQSALTLPECKAQAERISAFQARLDVERQDKEVTESARAAAIKVLYCLWQPCRAVPAQGQAGHACFTLSTNFLIIAGRTLLHVHRQSLLHQLDFTFS